MFFIVDLIIIGIILLFTFLGYKRGLIKVAIKLCTFIIAIIISFMLYKPVSNVVIQKTDIDEKIQTTITDRILPEGISVDQEVELSDSLPNIILNNGAKTVKNISSTISKTLIQTICFLIIFVAIKIVLKFVTFIADLIAKLPIINQFNKLGGTIYGFLEGLLVVFIALAIISLVAPLLDLSLLDAINGSTIGSILYKNNIFLKLIF